MLGNDAGKNICGFCTKISSLNSLSALLTLGRALLWLGRTVPIRGGRWTQSVNLRIGFFVSHLRLGAMFIWIKKSTR